MNGTIAEHFRVINPCEGSELVFNAEDLSTRQPVWLFAAPAQLQIDQVRSAAANQVNLSKLTLHFAQGVTGYLETPNDTHKVWLVLPKPNGVPLTEILVQASLSWAQRGNLIKSVGHAIRDLCAYGETINLTTEDLFFDPISLHPTAVIRYPEDWVRDCSTLGGQSEVDTRRMSFMSPEQLEASSGVGHDAILCYRFGVICYELVSGLLPFSGPINVLLRRILTEVPPNLRLPPEAQSVIDEKTLNALIGSLLQKSAAQRSKWKQIEELFTTLLQPQVSVPLQGYSSPQVAQQPQASLLKGRYQILEEIGRGGFGSVYLGLDTGGRFNKKVAIKLLNMAMKNNPEIVRRFEDEAKTMSELDHPGIVQLIDYGRNEHDQPFIVSELLQGQDLGKYLKSQPNGRLPVTATVEVIIQVVDALATTHSHQPRPIVHRDIKPENIFISEQLGGHRLGAKLLDFGISKSTEGTSNQTGQFMGTVEYMSPEQCEDTSRVDPRSDFYSLGIVFYEMLTGAKPYHATTIYQWIKCHNEAPVPRIDVETPPNTNSEAILNELNEIIQWMTQKDREQRPPEAQSLLTRLIGLQRLLQTKMMMTGGHQRVNIIEDDARPVQNARISTAREAELDPLSAALPSPHTSTENWKVDTLRDYSEARSSNSGIIKFAALCLFAVGAWFGWKSSAENEEKPEKEVLRSVQLKLLSEGFSFSPGSKLHFKVTTDPEGLNHKAELKIDPPEAGSPRDNQTVIQLTNQFHRATVRACIDKLCSPEIQVAKEAETPQHH